MYSLHDYWHWWRRFNNLLYYSLYLWDFSSLHLWEYHSSLRCFLLLLDYDWFYLRWLHKYGYLYNLCFSNLYWNWDFDVLLLMNYLLYFIWDISLFMLDHIVSLLSPNLVYIHLSFFSPSSHYYIFSSDSFDRLFHVGGGYSTSWDCLASLDLLGNNSTLDVVTLSVTALNITSLSVSCLTVDNLAGVRSSNSSSL